MSSTRSTASRRAGWTASLTKAADDEDVDFWLRVPVEERARVTWELSEELFELAERNGGVFDEATGERMETGARGERRLPRAAFRLHRR